MSNKRFWGSIVAVWLVQVATGWLFHGVWLHSLYLQTASFWRPESEMSQFMPVIWVGNFIFSWAFVWIYSKGINKTNVWGQAFRYAWAVIAISQVHMLAVSWAMSPYPFELVWKWALIGVVQAMLCAFAMTWTFNPGLAWKATK